MITFIACKHDLEKIQNRAIKNNCKIVSQENLDFDWIVGYISDISIKRDFIPPIEQIRASAKYYADNYLIITVEADQNNDVKLIGMFEKSDNGSSKVYQFSNSDLFQFNQDNTKSVDYQRCDRCNVKHNRIKSFVVELNGSIVQVGGSCASSLDLEKHVSKLRSAINGFSDDCEGEMFESFGKIMHFKKRMDLSFISVTSGYIIKHGYISRSQAQLDCEKSTADLVEDLKKASECTINSYITIFEDFLTDSNHETDVHTVYNNMLNWVLERVNTCKPDQYAFNHNLFLAVDQFSTDDLGMLTYACKAYIDYLNSLKVKSLPDVIKPLELPVSKTIDVPGSFMLKYTKIIYTDFGSTNFCIGVNEQGEGIQFKIKDMPEWFKPTAKFKIRGGIKGLNWKNELLCIERAKVSQA